MLEEKKMKTLFISLLALVSISTYASSDSVAIAKPSKVYATLRVEALNLKSSDSIEFTYFASGKEISQNIPFEADENTLGDLTGGIMSVNGICAEYTVSHNGYGCDSHTVDVKTTLTFTDEYGSILSSKLNEQKIDVDKVVMYGFVITQWSSMAHENPSFILNQRP